jgi:hypothetical protein
MATQAMSEIVTGRSRDLGVTVIPNRNYLGAQPPESETDHDLEQDVGDFIARHVLEKDSILFEG